MKEEKKLLTFGTSTFPLPEDFLLLPYHTKMRYLRKFEKMELQDDPHMEKWLLEIGEKEFSQKNPHQHVLSFLCTHLECYAPTEHFKKVFEEQFYSSERNTVLHEYMEGYLLNFCLDEDRALAYWAKCLLHKVGHMRGITHQHVIEYALAAFLRKNRVRILHLNSIDILVQFSGNKNAIVLLTSYVNAYMFSFMFEGKITKHMQKDLEYAHDISEYILCSLGRSTRKEVKKYLLEIKQKIEKFIQYSPSTTGPLEILLKLL